ncbi:MAG TPA: helix-turn-helix transcriptional regulator [Candidatus Obscuribacterales bacterium]
MKQFKPPIPSSADLANTLSQRVLQLRESRNLTVKDLGRRSRLSTKRIEDIEAGFETWLSATDRQMLAKALNVEPRLLEEVEIRPQEPESTADEQDLQRRIAEAILQGMLDHKCPSCGSKLRCSVEEALDIEGRSLEYAKAFCTKCPFVLR